MPVNVIQSAATLYALLSRGIWLYILLGRAQTSTKPSTYLSLTRQPQSQRGRVATSSKFGVIQRHTCRLGILGPVVDRNGSGGRRTPVRLPMSAPFLSPGLHPTNTILVLRSLRRSVALSRKMTTRSDFKQVRLGVR